MAHREMKQSWSLGVSTGHVFRLHLQVVCGEKYQVWQVVAEHYLQLIVGLKKGELKLKLIYERQSVGQSALVSGVHLGPVTNFYFSLKFPSDSCGFVIL
jgi:hypothetical protein